MHTKRIKSLLAELGHIGILKVTDKQLESMELFYSKKAKNKPVMAQQLELF